MEDLEKQIRRQQRELKAFLARKATKAMGRIAREEFTLNFRRQGYIDAGGQFHPWQQRKVQRYRRRGMTGKRSSKLRLTRAGKDDKGRAILVGKGSGRLRRDIKVSETTADAVTLSTSGITKDYAQVHNEGLRAGRGKGFTMPRRPFMVESKVLTDRIKDMIEQNIKNIFK